LPERCFLLPELFFIVTEASYCAREHCFSLMRFGC